MPGSVRLGLEDGPGGRGGVGVDVSDVDGWVRPETAGGGDPEIRVSSVCEETSD